VLPAGKKQAKQQQPADPDNPEPPHQQQQAKQKGGKSALAEKMAGSGAGGAQAAPARYPDLLRRYARMMPIYEVSGMSQLAKNQYASPFLQAMLRAAASDRWACAARGAVTRLYE
jgi:hypothetical protein